MRAFPKVKKSIKRTTAILLTMAMTVCGVYTHPQMVRAEEQESKEEYVSDVILYQGSLAAAQNEYSDYTFLTDNLNKDGGGGEVYMGYQVTTDADNAIRDLACMQMKGNYNTSDYDKILNEQREHLNKVLDQLQNTIEEFRSNYAEKQQRAIDAYEVMNKYYEEDTGLKMGDFFLDTSGKVTRENYINLMLQANSSTVNALESALASATDAGNTLWIDRLVAMGDNEEACLYDGLLEYKKTELQGRTGKVALRYFDDLYKDDIQLLSTSWESLRKGLQKYADCGVSLREDDEATVKAYVDQLEKEEQGSSSEFTMYGTLYEFLSDIQYGSLESNKKSLVDLFMMSLPVDEEQESEEEIDEEQEPQGEIIEETELYAILGSFTEGQRFSACTQGISELFWAAAKQAREKNVETETMETETDKNLIQEQTKLIDSIQNDENVDKFLEGIDAVEKTFGEDTVEDGALSVYAGVDRSFFESKIAMTCEATNKENSSGQPAFESKNAYISSIIAGSFAIATVAGGIITLCMTSKLVSSIEAQLKLLAKQEEIYREAMYKMGDLGSSLQLNKELGKLTEEQLENFDLQAYAIGEKQQGFLNLTEATATQKDPLMLKAGVTEFIGRAVGATLIAVGIGLTIYSVISAIKEYNEMKEKEKMIIHTPIPDKMVDQSKGEEGMGPYVYYSVVKNQKGEPADLNGKTSKLWLAMYTSKSKEAGRPILARDFGTVCYGTPEGKVLGMGYAHLFGQYSAQNLVEYSKNAEEANPVYFFFERSSESTKTATETASTFGAGSTTENMIYVLVLALGILGGFGLSGYTRKKKEEQI